MKWSLDLGIAVALTVLVWAVLHQAFPSEPLTAMETAFVLAVFYGLIRLCRLAWKRWGAVLKSRAK